MENKIKVFSSLPTSELTQISGTSNTNGTTAQSISIGQEFEETKNHTKSEEQTPKTSEPTTPGSTSTPNNATTEKKNRLGKVMSGDFAVNMVDMLLPGVLILLINRIGYAIDKKDLQLTAKEKEALAPAVQDCLDDINLDFSNPWTNLMVMVGIVYGSKLVDKMPSMKKKTVVKENKTVAEKMQAVVNGSGEGGEPVDNFDKFETDWLAMCDEIRKSLRKGMPYAKEYVAENYGEKIKVLAKKHGVPLSRIQTHLNFKAPAKKDNFNMP